MTLFESLTIREGWETKRWRGGRGEDRDGEGYRESKARTGVKRWKDEVERKRPASSSLARSHFFPSRH